MLFVITTCWWEWHTDFYQNIKNLKGGFHGKQRNPPRSATEWLLQHRALAPSNLHYFLAPPISNLQVMFCARDSNVSSFAFHQVDFFFEIKQRLKCKTYSIDKEETSIIILKSFSYKVISTDKLVCIYNYYNVTIIILL